jgi:hypothetical protein
VPVDENVNVAIGSDVVRSGPETMVVSGTTVASAATMANGERPSAAAQMTPAGVSTVRVTSTHSVPSWWRMRTGSV